MPRIYVDSGFDIIDIELQMDDAENKMFVKIKNSDGRVYSGELVAQDKEFITPPDELGSV
jgi:hypothetical protein